MYLNAHHRTVVSLFKTNDLKNIDHRGQGYNAKKFISEVYAFFVLQCTVSGR